MKYSIELVPRSWENIKSDVADVLKYSDTITVLNIPDLTRFNIRSWEACNAFQNNFKEVIPHLRAIDFDLTREFPLTNFLKKNNITSVLVVAGDQPQDLSKRTYRNTSCELIRILKKELPDLKVYAGIDQYRNSLRKELDYIHDKVHAGADGFFTQPFFDLKLLDVYMDLATGLEVYWGISPVHFKKSQSYWENKNGAVFPNNFQASKEWNIDFAKKMIEKIEQANGNIYFMPIRANMEEYLNDLLCK